MEKWIDSGDVVGVFVGKMAFRFHLEKGKCELRSISFHSSFFRPWYLQGMGYA